MAFTAQDVKTLREATGVGMMDCKKALVESDGDMEKATLYLRERGLAKAQKKAGRIAAEGVAYAAVIDGIGVVVEVNSETDFVAKNDKFNEFVAGVAKAVASYNPADIDALMNVKYPGTELTVAQQEQEMVLVIGEKISIRRFIRYADGFSVPYIHAEGKIGVLVNMEVSGISDMDAVTVVGKDIAMQIAAMNPQYLDSSSVSSADLEQEREIQLKKAIEENKAQNMPDDKARMIAEKKVEGRMNKFYEEMCLMNQPYVKENKLSVAKYVEAEAKKLGGTIVVNAFTRFERGEGIEKRQDDFAAEVASLV